MAKKRKASRADEPQVPAELDPRDSRKRIKTFEDVADSDDEFHLNQDEIRLGEDPHAKRRRQWAEQEEFLEPSDEEVLGYSEDDEDDAEPDGAEEHPASGDSEAERDGRHDNDEDDEFGWGTSRDALYGADAIETEEQALEEEAEALRLQKKQLESMRAADYGFDESDWQQGGLKKGSVQHDVDAVVTEVLPQLHIAPDLGPAERLKLLKSRYPEFDLLSRDLLDLKDRLSDLTLRARDSAIAGNKLRAATAYMGALAMYFSLFTSTASKSNVTVSGVAGAQLREHPIMECLVQTRASWHKIEQLSDNNEPMNHDADSESPDEQLLERLDSIQDLEQVPVEHSQSKKTRAQRHAEAVRDAANERRVERLKRTEVDLADLDALIAPSGRKRMDSKPHRTALITQDDSELGEEAPLTAQEAADKAKKKKSLRFYTSQIAQKANKRGAAGRNAGGDDDIPHRERLKDRQARLNAEAEKRGNRGVRGADLDADLGGESDEDDHRQAQQIRATADEDDYYDLVAARTAKKKSDKVALSEVQRQAAIQGGRVVEEEIVGADGKRKITYAIEKNKGLTPHRKKDVRNPRVKKRKKFEEKKKKLASIKPVYKGGEGRGGYGGELTGIKKGLVKSTKL